MYYIARLNPGIKDRHNFFSVSDCFILLCSKIPGFNLYIAYTFKKPYKILQIIDQFSTQFCFQGSQLIFQHCSRFLVFSVYMKSFLIDFSDYWSSRHENRIDYSVNIPFRNIFPGRKKPMASIHHEIETIFTSQFHQRY